MAGGFRPSNCATVAIAPSSNVAVLGRLDDQHRAFHRCDTHWCPGRQVRPAHLPESIPNTRFATALHDGFAQHADLAYVLRRALIEARQLRGLGVAALPVTPHRQGTDRQGTEQYELQLPGA